MVLSTLLMSLFVVLLMASVRKSLGVRYLYVKLLLWLFEYGRIKIEKMTRNKQNVKVVIDDEPDKEESVRSRSPPPSPNLIISKESLILVPDGEPVLPCGNENQSCDKENNDNKPVDFKIEDCLEYMKSGIEAIIEDDVTSRFEAVELENWNLLTRNNQRFSCIPWKLKIIWIVGFLIRYIVLMPVRGLICFIGVSWFVVVFAFIGCVPNKKLRQTLHDMAWFAGMRIIASSLSAEISFHNEENRPKNRGFCVANHTTPFDTTFLSSDCVYSLSGQRHGGFMGILQRAVNRASPHIWFERAESKDRSAVMKRLQDHVANPDNPPILIFPEGTCINNTSVMQFKKGAFEVDGIIYPVAIKYDPRFGNAFWNSSRYSMMRYIYMMMTSWAIVCDIFYLPPMYREEGESSIEFANRVKSVIAKTGGMADLSWDGAVKRMKPKKEWKEKQQEEFTRRLKGNLTLVMNKNGSLQR